MATLQTNYSTPTTITITLTSLADTSARESTVVDNTSNKFLDARLRIQTNGQSGGTGNLNVYVYSALGDTTYSGNATGTDAGFTSPIPGGMKFLGAVPMNAATAVVAELPSIASKFGGVMPDKWGIVVENQSGAALSATGGDHVVEYQGIKVDSV